VEHVYSINLNKGEDKVARIQKQMELQRWLLLLVLALIGAGEAWWIHDSNTRLNDLLAQKESQVEEVQAQLAKLQRTGKNLSKRDILNLAALEESRLLWSRKLVGLGEETTPQMALTDVRFEKGHLYITGLHKVKEGSDPIDAVMAFVHRLENNTDFNQNFSNIQFASSQDIISQDQKALQFEIRCKIEANFLSKTINFTSRKS
jgi:hypothetical protein